MAIKLIVRVMEEIEVTRPQQAVLLAMADHANDDGTSCYPSVDLIAWKAGYKPRNVTDIIRELRRIGVIEEVAPATGTRPTEYAIHLDRAPKKPPFEEWQKANGRHSARYPGVQSHENETNSGVQSHVSRGAVSREIGVQSHEEGCNLTSLGVQSHEAGVQFHEKTTRENAPRTVSRTVIEPLNREGGGNSEEPVSEIAHSIPKVDPNRFEKRFGSLDPFMLLAAMCDELDVRADDLPNRERGRQVAIAKTMQRDGVSADDVRLVTRWLKGQNWIKGGIDLALVKSQHGRWILAGRPDGSKQTVRKNAKPATEEKDRYDESVWLGDWHEYAGGTK